MLNMFETHLWFLLQKPDVKPNSFYHYLLLMNIKINIKSTTASLIIILIKL